VRRNGFLICRCFEITAAQAWEDFAFSVQTKAFGDNHVHPAFGIFRPKRKYRRAGRIIVTGSIGSGRDLRTTCFVNFFSFGVSRTDPRQPGLPMSRVTARPAVPYAPAGSVCTWASAP
jgi:hypothetical protein